MLLLSRADVEVLLDLDALLGALELAFIAYSRGECSVPPRVFAALPGGGLGAMPGHVPGMGLAAKLVTVFPANPERGMLSHQAVIALFDPSDGRPLALMDGTYITAMRTGAATAVAVRLLAPPGARVLAILGAGVQGQSHLQLVPRVLDVAEVRIASRTAAHAERLAERHPRARAVATMGEAVDGADVVCCCTDATEPIVDEDMVEPGALVTSVASRGHELAANLLRRARVAVEWRGAATSPPLTGATELQGFDPASLVELGEILDGRAPGRTAADERIVYKSTGHAIEDVAAARLVYDRALEVGAGTRIDL